MAEFESCDKCKYNMRMPNEEPCCGCIHNAVDNFKPKTNADRIREMRDEELAEFLEQVEIVGSQGGNTDFLEWLKSEVKEEA